jgi:hypothetical protein
MNEALSYAVSMDVRTYLALSSMPPPSPPLDLVLFSYFVISLGPARITTFVVARLSAE